MRDDGTKPALASVGIWGALVAYLAAQAGPVLTAVGITDPNDQLAIISHAVEIGAIIAAYGRMTAKRVLR